jgi:hypothetical protein
MLGGAAGARAQEPPREGDSAAPTPSAPGSMVIDPSAPAKAPNERPGRFRVGPFYFTPRIRIGSVGLDTNVFYTATDRRTDIRGSAGPGLEMVVPLGGAFRLVGDGGLDYIYFVRTDSLRHLAGAGGGGLEWSGARTSGHLISRYEKAFDRLSTEVDSRFEQRNRGAQFQLHRRLAGRTGLNLQGSLSRQTTPTQIVLGTDLGTTLTSESYGGKGGFDYALTSKTRIMLEGGADKTHFPRDPNRDAVRPEASIGLESTSEALVSGRAYIGFQWFRPADQSKTSRSLYSDVSVIWHLSQRTRLGFAYSKKIGYTAFVPVEGTPTVRNETMVGSLHKDLFKNFDVTLQARRYHSRTDNPVRFTLPSGETVDIRDDVSYEYSGELGFRISRLWLGGTAGYGRRRSSISDLGIEGLLLGGKIVFTP